MTHDTKAPEVMAPRADASSEARSGVARSLDASAATGRATESRTPDASGSAREGSLPSEASGAAPSPGPTTPDATPAKPGRKRGPKPNNVRRLRIERMMSKAELARRANLSVLTIDRVEKGYGCRMDTKRKILEALGLTLADRVRVFGEEE
jgi:DNA-binding XRE family transcriptional regulator